MSIIKDVVAGWEQLERVRSQERLELAGTGLSSALMVVCSALTGTGLEDFRRELGHVLAQVPPQPERTRVRLWLDRSFSITGAGTVVTGTLARSEEHTSELQSRFALV